MIDDKYLLQFIEPNGSGNPYAREMFNSVTERLLDFLGGANHRPPLPEFTRVSRGDFSLPSEGIGKEILDKVQQILECSMNAANVRHIGHMDSMPTLWSLLGELIATGINNNMLSLEMSPYLTQLEHALMGQFSEIFGLPPGAGGVMLSGGTLSNLQALTVARNIKLGLQGGNLTALAKQPVIFCSQHAHTSLVKAGMILGIGIDHVIQVKADRDSRMDVADLELKIKAALTAGQVPFAIVATAGTTVTGSIDPLEEISRIAKRFDLWLHVDAIYGGAVMLNERYAMLLRGIGSADSISFNPQKWMYVAKTCSMVLFASESAMQEAIRVSAPYMREQAEFTNLGEISIQGTRHAEVVKLYLTMLSLGKAGFSSLIEYCFRLKKVFLDHISSRCYLELSTAGDTNVLCFRLRTDLPSGTHTGELMRALHESLLEDGFFLSMPTYKGGQWLRCVLLNPFLDERTIELLFQKIDAFHAARYPQL